jgi:GNAT superfamily N-acetyltransferase
VREIRTIREDECDAFLDLLCEVFELDTHRAHEIFFSEPYFDIDRKWALFEGQQMESILTVTPVGFGWGQAVGIAGVATRKSRRREGLASQLLRRVLKEYERRGQPSSMLFARELGLYESVGFEPIDRVIRAPLQLSPMPMDAEDPMPLSAVREIYDRWAGEHPDRLRRDELRWRYWAWQYRACTPFQSGYLCNELSMLREAIYSDSEKSLPLPTGCDWFGTTFMADQLEIPLTNPVVDLYLMGRNVPGIPQMFMTDQF